MNRDIFETYVETRPAPVLKPGDGAGKGAVYRPRVAQGLVLQHIILRLRRQAQSRPFYAFIRPLKDETALTKALVVTTEQVWRREVEDALQRAFSFTSAEANVLRLIVSGASVTEIAQSLSRSEGTIRSQIHSLLSKTGTRSQVELISLLLVFQDANDNGTGAERRLIGRPDLRANPCETFELADGRRLDYLRLGDPQGRPFLWLHGNLAQCRLSWRTGLRD